MMVVVPKSGVEIGEGRNKDRSETHRLTLPVTPARTSDSSRTTFLRVTRASEESPAAHRKARESNEDVSSNRAGCDFLHHHTGHLSAICTCARAAAGAFSHAGA